MKGTIRKTKSKKWLKFRHKVVFTLLRPVFYLYFKLKYKLTVSKDEKKLSGPALIMSNHSTTMDPFILGCSFKRVVYYITSDDLFTIPIISRIIRWLVNPIPKSKSKSDLGTIRTTLKVLSEGGTVAVFPEGNRTLFGNSWEIDISTEKFAKVCKVPLVLYKIDGGYGADPRWGNKIRKGKVFGSVKKILSVEEIKNLSPEELLEVIKQTLYNTDVDSKIKFRYSKRAQFLERALYCCENCNSFNSFYSDKNRVFCRKCGAILEYNEDLSLTVIKGNFTAKNTVDYYEVQKQKLFLYSSETKEPLFNDIGVTVRMIYDKKRHVLGKANIIGYNNGIKIETEKNQDFYPFKDLLGVTILGKRKINFYLDGEKTLQIKGSKRFNGIKYLHLYQFDKEKK